MKKLTVLLHALTLVSLVASGIAVVVSTRSKPSSSSSSSLRFVRELHTPRVQARSSTALQQAAELVTGDVTSQYVRRGGDTMSGTLKIRSAAANALQVGTPATSSQASLEYYRLCLGNAACTAGSKLEWVPNQLQLSNMTGGATLTIGSGSSEISSNATLTAGTYFRSAGAAEGTIYAQTPTGGGLEYDTTKAKWRAYQNSQWLLVGTYNADGGAPYLTDGFTQHVLGAIDANNRATWDHTAMGGVVGSLIAGTAGMTIQRLQGYTTTAAAGGGSAQISCCANDNCAGVAGRCDCTATCASFTTNATVALTCVGSPDADDCTFTGTTPVICRVVNDNTCATTQPTTTNLTVLGTRP